MEEKYLTGLPLDMSEQINTLLKQGWLFKYPPIVYDGKISSTVMYVLERQKQSH
mgnify:CR=1 FL=1